MQQPHPGAPLADPYLTLYRSPDPARVFCTTPGITALPDGRLVATHGVKALPPATLPAPMTPRGEGPFQWQTLVYTSDDAGRSWIQRAVLPMLHARPFAAGGRVYLIGHGGDLRIARSDDAGQTWSAAVALTTGQWWHQAACAVEYGNGRVYVVMERRTHADLTRWDVAALAPVVLAAAVDADLLQRSAWTFSNELTFRDAVSHPGPLYLPPGESRGPTPMAGPGGFLHGLGIGIPFYPGAAAAAAELGVRPMPAPGWLETNLVRFRDPAHIWHDPSGRTLYLWMRAHTGTTNLAAIARAVEGADGSLTVDLARAPSGAPVVFVPCPGGQMKFFILYDAPSRRFWLVSTQSTDSMARPGSLAPGRHGLPHNERQRLALHASTNCVDWCFAGLVAAGATAHESRHYAAAAAHGDDLLILSRSGDAQARNPHDCNLITLHRVTHFRRLAP